jgi:FkbH-like protein
MSVRLLRAVVLADFNAANFAAYLTQEKAEPQMVATAGSMGDLGADHLPALDAGPVDVAILWTRPDAVSAAFAGLTQRGVVDVSDVTADVDDFVERLQRLRERFTRIIVMTWVAPHLNSAFGSLAMKERVGASNVLMRMNLRLAERLETMPGVVLLDATAWMGGERTPEEAKLWYAAKIPFRNDVFRRAARQVKSTLRASTRGPRKLILVDLDDTLWGGLVGEVGWPALRLGGHDPVGEAHADFQKALLALSHRGILLGIISKNEEHVALDAIAQHPEMQLRLPHFSGWRINWDDKAANIVALTQQLNLGLDAVVFIDDSAAERGRVREALPEVLVPEWPASPMLYVHALIDLGCFDMVAVTEEDRSRSQMYAAEQARASSRIDTASTADWLRRLDLQVGVEELSDRNLSRIVQLLNKTNQMNLSTRRMDAAELTEWLREGRRALWSFRVSDRFGDAGLTGVASVDLVEGRAVLVDFVLSCRVFGRRIEELMLHVASRWAIEHGASDLVATLLRTSKNGPCLSFLDASGMARQEGDRFVWSLAEPFPCPAAIDMRREMELTR